MARHIRPKGHPQRGGGGNGKRGRHKKATSRDVRRRIAGFEQIDWRRWDESEEAA